MLCYLRSLHTYTFAIHSRRICFTCGLRFGVSKERETVTPIDDIRRDGGASYKKGEGRVKAEARRQGFARPSSTENKVFGHVSRDNPPWRALSRPPSPRELPNRNTAPQRLPSSLLHLATHIQSSSDRSGQNPSLFPFEFAALGQRELGGERDGKARIRRVSV
jgi:hypothetical protein